MFGKLLKYELKSVGKWYLTLNAAVLLVSISIYYFRTGIKGTWRQFFY